MKPNLVVIQPSHPQMDSMIERFCEEFCESHYVYLIRPNSEFRDDSPAGVRFLGHSLDQLPRFGSVDTAVAVADANLAERLKDFYPESKLVTWDPQASKDLPELIGSIEKPKVVRGEFGEAESGNFAQAI
jgi:hypothetical protein